MYYSDVWIGFLCENIVRQVAQLSKLRCPGCDDKLFSPLLHLHEQLSMLDKLRLYFEEVRGAILPTLPELYTMFQAKLPHSDNLDRDQECYISIGHNFLLTIGADSLYYGRYLSDLNDGYINEGFKIPKKRKSDACQPTINEGVKLQKKRKSDGCQTAGKSKPNKKVKSD